jgi:acetyl esterase
LTLFRLWRRDGDPVTPRGRGLRKLIWCTGGAVLALLAAVQLSPWPAALVFRWASDLDAWRVARALRQHVPSGVTAQLNEPYGANTDPDTQLDVFHPTALARDAVLPTVLWIHGGGWISGSKEQVGNYLRILAAHGYTTVALGYSLAPGHTYPTPLRQANEALGFLAAEAARLHVDPARLVLAGDSAGAQIAAQLAAVVTEPGYARELGIVPAIRPEQLRGVLLYCGAYELRATHLHGGYGFYLRTLLWSYSGSRDFARDPGFATASVLPHLSGRFPPSFITVGNADPLRPQSHALADALARRGVGVDSLFFPDTFHLRVPHEYQFNLDNETGQTALRRSLEFLARR